MQLLAPLSIAASALLALAPHTAHAQAAAAAGQAPAQLFVSVTGHGPPVVFLHGGLNDFEHAFPKQAVSFAPTHTVIGIDQRGHGHSRDSDADFSYREMARDTAGVLQRLGRGPYDIVGHSDGGNVGLLLASTHPELVRRLVISGANTRGDTDGLWAYLRSVLTTDASFERGFPDSMRDTYASVSPEGAAHWTQVLRKTKKLWETWTVITPAELAAIRAPVLVMAGEHDVIPADHTREIARALPHATLCILPGAGHSTMNDDPAAFDRAVQEFLDGEKVPGCAGQDPPAR